MFASAERIRNIGGLLALLTLLSMMVVDFVFPEHRIPDRTFQTLLLLISTFLGLDMIRERSDIVKAMVVGALQGYMEQNSGSGEDNDK